MSLHTHILRLLVLITVLSDKAKGQQCDQPLGFRDGRINDSQISASSSWHIWTPNQARYETGYGWMPAQGTLNQYLHVDLLTSHRVTRYLIQGVSSISYVRSLSLFYSQSGYTWERYVSATGSSVLPGSPNSSSVGSVDLIPPIEARFLVFQPREGKGLRLELMGCEIDQQTNTTFSVVTEDIEEKQEWSLSKSPYFIDSKIRIKTSGHVKVQPGVKVIFNSTDAGLVVDGTLEAIGQSSLPVEFGYPRFFSHQADQWSGLEVSLWGNITLEHCDVYGASTGLKAPLSSVMVRSSHIHENNVGIELTRGDTDRGRVQLTHTRIANNSEQGIRLNDWSIESSFLNMRSCQIDKNGDSGLQFDTKLTLYADNCAFTDNQVHGLTNKNYTGYYVIMAFNKCKFTDNRGSGFHLNLYNSSSEGVVNLTVSDSQVSRNKDEGIAIDLHHPPRGMAITVRDSHIFDNKGNGIGIRSLFDKGGATITVINSTFSTTNTFSHLHMCHLFIYSDSTVGNVNVVIQDNTLFSGMALWMSSTRGMTCMITNNRITTSPLYPEPVGLKITGTGGDITLYKNHFINCTNRVLSVHTPIKITKNIFFNPKAEVDVYLFIEFRDDDRFNISHNYWGSSDKFHVRSRICDFFCDTNSIIADVHPFYTTENMTELSTEMDSGEFSFQTGDTIGGILTDNLVLDPHQYLFVNRSLYVPEGYTLSIGENVTLVFPHYRGILAQGSLDIQGTEDNKVMFIGAAIENRPWNGIKLNGTGSSIKHAVIQNAIVGVNITNPGRPIALTVSDTLFLLRGRKAISANLNYDTELILRRVEIKESFAALSVVMSETVTASVVMTQCQIESVSGIVVPSVYSAGHLNISMSSTTIISSYKPCISSQACKTKVTMLAENTTFFTMRNNPFVDISSSLLNIHYRHLSGNGGSVALRLHVCPVMNQSVPSGIIDIKDSRFRAYANNYALDLGSFRIYSPTNSKFGCFIPHDIVLVNNTFLTMSSLASVYIETGGNCSSWKALMRENTFEQSGIDINGVISNTTIEGNTFYQSDHAMITVNLQGYESSTTTVVNNTVHGGSVILNSENRIDIFNIEKNVLTRSNMYITTSNVQMYENTFHEGLVDFRSETVVVHDIQLNTFNGTQMYIQNPNMTIQKNKFLKGPSHSLYFNSNCYSESKINCSHNYWGTRDKDEIATKIYDSKNDKNLPEISFIPFYGYPNLTDLQYHVDSFFSPDGSIGGSIEDTVTLNTSGSPYNVTKNIVVGSMGKLNIEAGVKLMFSRWVGITVLGTIRILGTASQPVIAQSLVQGQRWSGIKVLNPVYRPDTATSPTVRLVGGCDGKEGRLEVMQGETWGTVCGHHFDQREAKVICRMLGYDPTVTHQIFYNDNYGQGEGNILMGGLECEGTENSLEECHMSTFNCSHQQDVALRCNGKLFPTRKELTKEVELRHFSMMHTEMGLELDGIVTAIENVSSIDSSRHGITVKPGIVSPLKIIGLSSVRNRYSGLLFDAAPQALKGRYIEISISNSDFSSNTVDGIHILNSVNMSLHNCQFNDNTESGIYLKSKGIIHISHSQFTNNVRGAFDTNELKRYKGFLHFSLKDSKLVGNVGRGVSQFTNVIKLFPIYTEPCKYEFINNFFTNNHGNLIILNTHRSTLQNSLHIINNTFESNNAGIVQLKSAIRNSVNFYFVNNTAVANMVSNDDHLIKVDIKTSLIEIGNNASHVQISDNIFTKNNVQNVVDIRDVAGFQSNISITRNTFTDNSCSRTLILTGSKPLVTFNIFRNPLAQCELESPLFIRGFDINGRWNYWGIPDVESVVSKICGFDTDMARGFIYYLPFYLSMELAEHSGDAEFWISNLVGGVVESQIRLNVTKSPYYINRSIYIRGEGVLIIESGVEMRFKPDTGIYVDGILSAGTSAEDRVTLTRAENSPWYGVVFPYKAAEVKKSVRLVDDLVNSEGRVGICYNGSWTDVCKMDYPALELVCQALGYRGVFTHVKNIYGEGTGSHKVELRCGRASSLSECQIEAQQNVSQCISGAGVACRQFVALPGPHESSYLERVSILGSKEGVLIQTSTVKLSNCHINNTIKAGITLNTDATDLDLDLTGTVVEHGKSDGILVRVSKNLRIFNGTTQFNLEKGINLVYLGSNTLIENMTFVGNNLFYEVENINSNNRLHINGNLFEGMESGLYMSMRMRSDYDANIFVEKNQFHNNDDYAVRISMTEIGDSSGTKRLFVRGNDFKTSISLISETELSIYVENNTAKDIDIGEQCFLLLDARKTGKDYDHTVSIAGNYFRNISGECVAHLKSTRHSLRGSFDYNEILNSSSNEATVLLNSTDFRFSYNSLSNPPTQYEMKVLLSGDEEIKAESNWWGYDNLTVVGDRILDKKSISNLLNVDYTPVLMDMNFDCSSINNCNGNGKCVRPGGCWCELGWTGMSCSDFDCSDLDNCSGNGNCNGPNLCMCSEGWGGQLCGVMNNKIGDKCTGNTTISPSLSTSASTSVVATTTAASTDSATVPDVSRSTFTQSSILWIIVTVVCVLKLLN